MKLEENMYVRTKYGIQQIYEIDEHKTKWKYLYKLKKQDGDGCVDLGTLSNEDIIKASFDVIDLMEVKDIIEIDVTDEDNYSHILGINFIRIENERDLSNIKDMILNESAKLMQILTHEQFEKSSYKVEE